MKSYRRHARVIPPQNSRSRAKFPLPVLWPRMAPKNFSLQEILACMKFQDARFHPYDIRAKTRAQNASPKREPKTRALAALVSLRKHCWEPGARELWAARTGSCRGSALTQVGRKKPRESGGAKLPENGGCGRRIRSNGFVLPKMSRSCTNKCSLFVLIFRNT